MPDAPSDLRQTFNRIRVELTGEARSAALEQHLEAVEAEDDRPLLNDVLVALVNSYEYSQDDSRLIAPFARLLHNYDTAPEHFDTGSTHSVYWMFKWVVNKLIEHPDVPLASIEDWLDQMRSRYAEAGHSLHPVHAAEHVLADHLGDEDRAAKAHAAMSATEPDHMSDCTACRCHYAGRVAADAGEHERALELWSPVLDGELRCAHEPHAALASSLLPLTELGRLDRARANHVHGYQISRDQDDMVYAIAKHARFCALTGNEARAIEILTAHARYFDLRLDPQSRRQILEAAQITSAALIARGSGDIELPGPDQRTWRADELHERTDRERRDICERYDRRNGNDAQTRASEARVRLDDRYPHVPLGLKALPGTEPARTRRPAPAPPSEDRFADLLAEARAASDSAESRTSELWSEVDRMAQRLGKTLEQGDLAEVLLSRIDPDGDRAATLALAERATEAFAAAGRPGRALSNRASTLVWRASTEPDTVSAETASVLDEADRLAADEPVAALRTRALVHIALLHCHRTRGERPAPELLAAIEATDAELARFPDERRLARTRVRLTLTTAEHAATAEAALDALRSAFELASAGEHTYETFMSAGPYASMLNQAGRFEDGLAVAETGLAAVRPDHPAFPVAALHLTATECAVNLGHWESAERYGVLAAAHYDRAGEDGCAAVARHLVGVALCARDRYEEAAVFLEMALADLPSMSEEEHWRLVDARVKLAECHRNPHDAETGAEHVLEALRLMDGGLAHPNRAVYPHASHLAGVLLEQLDRVDAAREAYQRADTHWREIGALPGAANSVRAAVWLDHEPDDEVRESGAAVMRALAEELRADWRDEELPFGYREACRSEAAETLVQHAQYLGFKAPIVPLLREALDVAGDGEFLVDPGFRAAIGLMNAHHRAGDLAAVEAVAAEASRRLDPERYPRQAEMVQDHLEHIRDANGQ